MFDPPITTTGTIVDSPKPKVYHVALPNGKIAMGHVQKAMIHLHENLKEGVQVSLELTPFDFSKARITRIIKDSE